MALFGDLSKEALPAKKIAAHLSRLLPDFTTDPAPLEEHPADEMQENHLRRAVEAADIISIAMACSTGRVATRDLPLLLSNPVIAKATTIFLTTPPSMTATPIGLHGDLDSHFIDIVFELTELYGRGNLDLATILKQEFVDWRKVAAVAAEGVHRGILSKEDVPYVISDGTLLTYLIRALQLMSIMDGRSTSTR
jgi:hypothetical protein